MRILVVFTGGTIGSSVKDNVADLNDSAAKQLLAAYPDIDFVCKEPFSLLSENSTIDTIEMLCNYMLALNYDDYDGVIVTHGSDTLGYTAASLDIALSWLKIPVMITGADYVLNSEHSNGRSNFGGCVDFIRGFSQKQHNCFGVYVVWKNKSEAVKIHRADRIEQADFNDSFRSFGEDTFGYMKNGCFIKNREASQKVGNQIFSENLKGRKVRLSRKVLILRSYAGADFDCISVKNKDAVLVQLYHSGTVCTAGENTSFVKFATRCKEQNVNVYAFSFKERKYVYISMLGIDADLMTPLFDTGECSAYAGLIFKYGEYTQLT